MTAKRYLAELKRMSTCIEQKEAEKQALYSASLGSSMSDRERVSGSSEDKMPDTVGRIVELEAEIDHQIVAFLGLKHTIIDQIQALDNENFIAVLHKRYVEFKRLEEIACEMNYTYQYTRELHGRALQKFYRQYEMVIAAYSEAQEKHPTQTYI